LETSEIFGILDIIVGLWWAYGLAGGVLIWYAVSASRHRTEDAVGVWNRLMDARTSEDDPVPTVTKYRTWDVTVYYTVGASLTALALICLLLKGLALVAGVFNSLHP